MSILIRNLRPGRQQTIDGRVVRLVDDDDFVLRDRSGRILVDLDLDDRRLPLRSGERVRVVGRLDRDDFDFDAQRVVRPDGTVLYDRFRPQTSSRQSNTLARSSQNQPVGASLQTLTGTVEQRVDDDEFILRDAVGRTLIEADLDDRFLPLQPGESVTVTGRLDLDDADFDALRITRNDGTVLYDRLGLNPMAAGPSATGSSAAGVSLTGSRQTDLLTGGAGNDQLRGQGGADRLLGAGGDDLLVGGAGRDTLVGGAGSDRFVYQSMPQGGDRILDFSAAEDVIDLRPLVAGSGVLGELPEAEYLRFNQVGAQTQIQIDLDGRAGSHSFKTLMTLDQTVASTLTAQNFLI